ncbi:MAG: T9SS type A sorting domain-containing protein [Rhodothermales bacterium]
MALRNRDRLENVWPFALFGDIYGDYVGRTFKAGTYVVSATPYSEDFRAGTKGPTASITIEFIDEDVAGSVVEELVGYPNPFNPQTTIFFELNQSAHVELKVYDMLGREVAVLLDNTLASGNHQAIFEATGLTSGVYYARLVASGDVVTQQLLLMK